MADPFRYYLRVRYGECDAQKVVFNARYADYVDLATTEFLRALGQWDTDLAQRDVEGGATDGTGRARLAHALGARGRFAGQLPRAFSRVVQ